MRITRRAWLASVLATGYAPLLHARPELIGLLVEPLDGPEPLGQKAATILHLQIWRTLRVAPPGNIHRLSFGRGIVYWDEQTPPPKNHTEAAERARGIKAQLVLWGKAQPYGQGIVVQAYLTVVNPGAPDNLGTKLWKLPLPELGKENVISVDIPAWTFEFAPIVLRREVIPKLNTPEGIPIYSDRTFQTKIGALGGDFKALEQGPDMAMVKSGGKEGWVRLPNLGASRSEVTDFAGGLLRVFRKDWGGAIDLMKPVVANPRAPVNIKISSYLIIAACSWLLHKQVGTPNQSLGYVEAAEQLNRYLQQTVRYKCMALLSLREHEAGVAERLDATIKGSEYLFPSNDAWLGTVKTVARKLSGGSG